jgi:2-phosphoglycolate phosphatase
MNTTPKPIQALLFDLDGTLADTAPDLCGTIQDMQADRGVAVMPIASMAHWCSGGARALLLAGFGLQATDPLFTSYRNEFLQRYETRIAQHTQLYPGIAELLADLNQRNISWGVVTNKPFYLAEKLMTALDLRQQCGVLVGGDSAAQPKPSPLPCLMAAQALGVQPENCVMVGDDERDVAAGKAAGMYTLAVGYGYITSALEQWGADKVIPTPQALQEWITATL